MSPTDPNPALALADGAQIPVLALGVWQARDGKQTENAVRWALEAGYRHIDTAQAYGNEESVGRGIRASGVPRDEIYVTTKFYPESKDPAAEAERSLDRLGLDYLDLYIIHWPAGGPTWAWPGMETAKDKGFARSIGVSNFSVEELDALLAGADQRPVINQVQFSPFEYRKGLLDACAERQVVVEAYSPLGTGRHLDDKKVAQIAERVGRTPAQVLLRWAVQKKVVVLAKSTHQERIEENGKIFDFELSDEDVAALDALDRTGGTDEARADKWWS